MTTILGLVSKLDRPIAVMYIGTRPPPEKKGRRYIDAQKLQPKAY